MKFLNEELDEPSQQKRDLLKKALVLGAIGGAAALTGLGPEAMKPAAADTTNGSVAYYSGGGTTGDNANFFWDSTNKRLGIDNNSPGFNLHVVGTTDPASITVDAIGASVGPNFMFRRARGTPGSPSAVQSGDGLLFLVARGYGSGGWSSGGRASVSMYAAENWTNSAQGAYMVMRTTPTGSTTQTERMRITDGGYVGIGTTNPAYMLDVDGTVHAPTFLCGDLSFKEKTCAIDREPFKVGDSVALVVKSVQADGIRCVPIHSDHR